VSHFGTLASAVLVLIPHSLLPVLRIVEDETSRINIGALSAYYERSPTGERVNEGDILSVLPLFVRSGQLAILQARSSQGLQSERFESTKISRRQSKNLLEKRKSQESHSTLSYLVLDALEFRQESQIGQSMSSTANLLGVTG
jgi:hypothetical protein